MDIENVKSGINRRSFLKSLSGGMIIGATPSLLSCAEAKPKKKMVKKRVVGRKSVKFTLRNAALNKEQVDRFLDPNAPNFAKFDPKVGYTLRNFVVKDGMNGAWTISTYGKNGERKMINYADRPCRINTYGNSFTQCEQVSDGESWQEYLAAHFGEPIRNFGVGGWGVYQAYLRLMEKEVTEIGTEYVILNMWIDDHLRNLDSWRMLRCAGWFKRPLHKNMFHCNPWDHLRIDMETGKVVEVKSLCPTPESLYKLCDKDYVYETFKDDIIFNLWMTQRFGADTDTNIEAIEKLAKVMGMELDFRTPDKVRDSAEKLYWEYGFRSSEYIMEKLTAFVEEKKKKLMVMLTYPGEDIVRPTKGLPRRDQRFIDYLEEKKIPFICAVDKHLEDFKNFNISIEDYLKRYYIGHYNPVGNHFFAFAVKDDLLKWLDPVPTTYLEEGTTIRFKEYLPPEKNRS